MTIKLKERALLLEGGPLAGRGWYVRDWERFVAAEVAMGRPDPSYYVRDETGGKPRMEIHPQTGGSRGGELSERWVWRPPAQPKTAKSKPAMPRSEVEQVYCAVADVAPFGASIPEVARATGYGQVQIAPLLGWLVLKGRLRRVGDQFEVVE